MKQSATLLLILILLITLISGCSSSSNTLRYSKKNDQVKEDKDSVVRFTSDNDYDELSSTPIDSLCCDDEISEAEDPGDLPDEESTIDISDIMTRFGSKTSDQSVSAGQLNHQERVLMEIIKFMNTPYKFGGNSIDGIDCSAFTQTVFRDALSITIFRSAREQFTQGEIIKEKEKLEFGDLVFFNTRRRVRPGHVGIYIGENLFAHASTKHGVTISSLDHNYYSARYMGARRIQEGGIF